MTWKNHALAVLASNYGAFFLRIDLLVNQIKQILVFKFFIRD